jgi:hypothetical protein
MKRPVQSHATEEKKILKKGGASPRLMAEEKAEYAKKGVKFASGGVVKRATAKTRGAAC